MKCNVCGSYNICGRLNNNDKILRCKNHLRDIDGNKDDNITKGHFKIYWLE